MARRVARPGATWSTPRTKATWLTATEKTWLVRELQATDGIGKRHNPLRAMLDVRILLLSAVYSTKNCGGYVLIFFMPQIIRSLTAQDGQAYSTLTISLLTAIPSAAAVAAGDLWAVNSDRMQERRWHAALPLLVGAAGVVWSASTSDPIVLLVAFTVASVGISSMTEAFFQIPSTFLSGPVAAVGIAVVNAAGNLGGFVGPYAFGLLQQATGSFYIGTVALAGLLVVGAGIIFLPMFRPQKATRLVA